jgi:plasmid stabilization system protein ParE
VATVFWTLSARRDLRAIHEYIALDSVEQADAFVASLERATERLEHFPMSGRLMPEEPSGRTREVIHGDYRIAYTVVGERVIVVGVWHGAMDLGVS